MLLSNEHIRLRKLEPEDLPYLYIIENDEKAWQFSDNHNPLSHKDLSDYILSSTGDIYKDGQLRLIIETADTEPSVVGCVDLYDFDIRNLRAGIGIYILDEYRNQCFASEAIELLKTYASEFLHIRILFAIVLADNSYSVSLFKKSGFSVSAQLADWFCDSDAVLFTKTFS